MKIIKNQKGVAMMMALITFLVLSILIGELAYETGVYNGVVWRQADQLRARLLARSALRLALLQIRAAEKAKEKAKSINLPESITDQIWQTPLILPPPAPPGLGVEETKSLEEFTKNLGLDGSLAVSISGENGRLNLNQLVWVKEKQTGELVGGQRPALTEEKRKELQQTTKQSFAKMITELLETKRQSDDTFRDKYGSITGETLVGNILAWMDPNQLIDGDNREKKDYYSRFEPTPYSLKDAPLFSESELYMVKGFDDSLVDLFSENFTTQTTGGLNVNDASPNLIQALIPEIGENEIDQIQKRRSDEKLGGKFKDAKDFWEFLNTFGNFEDAKKRLDEQGIAILEKESSYRVIITAKSGSTTKTWFAKIGPMPPKIEAAATDAPNPNQPNPAPLDLGKSAEELAEQAQKNEEQKKKNSTQSNSLNIIYLKGD
jgi:type II secretory pathway component PulK